MDPDMVEGEEEVKLSRLDDTSEEPPEGDYDNAESQYQQEEEEEEGQHTIVPQFQQDDEEEEERETEIVPETQTQQDEEEEKEEDSQIKIVPEPHLQQEEEEDEESQQTEMVPGPQLQEEEAEEEEDKYEEITQIQQEKEEDEQQTETLPEEFQQEEEEEQDPSVQEAEVQQKTVTENEAPKPPVRKPLPATFLNRELTIGDIVRFLGETAAENNATESATAIVRSAIRAARGTDPQTPEEKRKQDLNNEKNAEIKKDKPSPAEIEEAKKEELLKEAARQEALSQQAMLEQAKLEAEEKLAMIQKQLVTMEHLPPNMQEQLSSLLHDINDMVAQKLAEIKPAPEQGEATEGEFIQKIPEPPKEEPKTWDYALEIEPCAPFYHPPDLGIGSTSEPKSRTTERSTTSTPVEKPNTGSPVQHERTDSPTQDRKSNIQWQHESLQGNRRLFPLPPPPKPYVMPCKLKLEMVALQSTERKL